MSSAKMAAICLGLNELKSQQNKYSKFMCILYGAYCTRFWDYLEYFTVSLHSPNDRQLGLYKRLSGATENGENCHQSHDPTMHCSIPRMH